MKTVYAERFYRGWCVEDRNRLISYSIRHGYSDLFIKTDGDHSLLAERLLEKIYDDIVVYSRQDARFLSAMEYYSVDFPKPAVVKLMFESAKRFNVGPMAAVAGAVSQIVGENLAKYSGNVIVENGGDIFLKSNFEVIVGMFAGNSPFSGRVGIRMNRNDSFGVCTSSGTVGPSKSFGVADAAVVVAENAAVADAAATALGNLVKEDTRIQSLLKDFIEDYDLLGGVIIRGGEMSVYRTELISI